MNKYLLILLFLLISSPVRAAEFSADLVQQGFSGNQESKFYIKGNKSRTDTADNTIIIDPSRDKAYILDKEEKIYYEMPQMAAMAQLGMNQAQLDEEIANIADKKQIGTEKVNGYECEKYEIVYHDTNLGKMTQWYSKKLDYPIKMVYQSPLGKMTTEYTNIKTDGISDSLFELPADYKKMSFPGLGLGEET